MIKATLLALLGLIAVTSANKLEVPFRNFYQSTPTGGLIKSVARSQFGLQSSASSVKWGSCDDQGVYDVAKGSNTPEPPKVGSDVSLNLDVIFNTQVSLSNLGISV